MESGEHFEALSAGLLGALGPDLLNAVFLKLGPSPMHLAALPSVCHAWRNLVYETTFKHLCEERAPEVCKAMVFSAANPPVGGWQVLFKMLTFCPGMFDMFGPQRIHPDAGDYGWWDLMGHVQEQGSSFQTGREVLKDLGLDGTSLERDVVFITRFCDHKFAGDTRNPQGCAARGLIRNFLVSTIAERSGVTTYLRSSPEVQEQMRRDSHDQDCVYCKAPMLWIVPKGPRADADTDQRGAIRTGFITIVQVCMSGHFTLMGLYNGTSEALPSLKPESISSSGGTQKLETLKMSRRLAKAYATDSWSAGSALVQSVNALTVAEQLKSLAKAAEEMRVGEAFDDEANEIDEGLYEDYERSGPSTDLGVLEHLEAEWHELDHLGDNKDSKSSFPSTEPREALDLASISPLEEVQSNLEAGTKGATLFWHTPPSTSNELSMLFRVVPKSEAILQRYLSNKRSACVTMKQLGRLRTLGFKRSQLEDAHMEVQRRRTKEAEAAVREAGIQQHHCGGGIFSWPDQWALYEYAEGVGMTLNELIARQRRALESAAARSSPEPDAET